MNYTLFKKACLITVAFCLIHLSKGCYRNDIRTVDIKVPQLAGEPCAKVILRSLSKKRGVKQLSFDYTNRLAIIEFDSKSLSIKNLEHKIADLGFDVQAQYKEDADGYLIPANEKARNRLSPSCR